MDVIKQDSLVVKEIEKRQQILDKYDEKVEKLAALKAEAAVLEKEVSETNTFELKAEIEEFKDYAIKLGHIAAPVVEEATEEEKPVIQQSYQTNII